MDSQDLKQAGLDYLQAQADVDEAELALSAAEANRKETSARVLDAYKAVIGSLDYDDDAGYASGEFNVKDDKGEVFAIQLYEDGVNSVSNLWIL